MIPVSEKTFIAPPEGRHGEPDNWPPEPRVAFPPWNGPVKVTVKGNLVITGTITMYISGMFGCHSWAFCDIDFGLHPGIPAKTIANVYGFDAAEACKGSAGWISETMEKTASNLYYSHLKEGMQDGHIQFIKDVNRAVYAYIHDHHTGNKVMLMCSDRISRSAEDYVERVSTVGFVNYMAERGWCVTGSPIAANQNYFSSNTTLVQGYILLRPIQDAKPRIAYDTAFCVNRDKEYTLKRMEDYFATNPNKLAGYMVNFRTRLGRVVEYFGKHFLGV